MSANYTPIDGDVILEINNPYLGVRVGASADVGGDLDVGSLCKLQPSTNTLLGYGVGNMLAVAAGDGTGIYADLIEGALVNFDPDSTDTGQRVWNGMIISDPALRDPLPVNSTITGGTIEASLPLTGWVIRQDILYAGGIPTNSGEKTKVNTAVRAFTSAHQFSIDTANGDGDTSIREIVFSY